jgi:molybdopterin molybdotransferase
MNDISFDLAYDLVINNITPVSEEVASVEQSVGRATAEDICSLVDSPSADVSLKDGYACISEDIENASPDNPVILELIGSQFAGTEKKLRVTPGKAVKITSGAVIPGGATGVLSEEFAAEEAGLLRALANVGENVLKKGTDIKKGNVIIPCLTTLTPTQAGLIAAGGHSTVNVYRKPLVTIIATGDEIVAPGKPIGKGKVAASNLVTLAAWCSFFHMKSETLVVSDRPEEIAVALGNSIAGSDSVITSGGAWKSVRDMVVGILDDLGWQKMFHRVKIGPGKAVAFGMHNGKPVFCLPGGPPSNQMAFLQLALPGLRCLGGHKPFTLPSIPAVLEDEVGGQKDWTQFVLGFLKEAGASFVFSPQQISSRLQRLSRADGIICIPEGIETISAGSVVRVQVMSHLNHPLCTQSSA